MMTRASAKRKAAGEPVVRPAKKTKVKAGKAAKARPTKPLSPKKLVKKPSARSDPHKRALVEFTNAELQMAKYMNETGKESKLARPLFALLNRQQCHDYDI